MLINKIKFNYWFFSILLISFIIGLYIYDCKLESLNNDIIDISFKQKLDLFKEVLLKNLGFAILITIGFLFYNISTLALLFYNGLMWGFFFKKYYCEIGALKTTYMIISHIFLEIIWIYYLSLFSFLISETFYKMLNKEIEFEMFYNKFVKTKNMLIKGFFIVLISAIIESFLSIEIYKLLI